MKTGKTRLSRILVMILAICLLTSCGSAGAPGSGSGVSAVEAVYPAAVGEGKEAQEFSESEEYRAWQDSCREKWDRSLEIQPEMRDYYQALIRQMLVSEDDNTVCSPLNIYAALAMLAEIADGNTRNQILDALRVNSVESLRSRVTALWESNYADTPILKSLLADSLWLRDSEEYNSETLERLAKEYYASTYSGTPGSEEMNAALRGWTDKNTGGLLSEYTKDMALDPETVIALVSAIYYKAAWYDEFLPEANTQETFHGARGDTTVEMMHRTEMMNVFQTDEFSSVSLGLKDSGAMYFFLPNEGVDVNTLPENAGVFDCLMNSEDDRWSYPEVNLSVPKFKVSGKTDLLDTIRALGITDALDASFADFSRLTEESRALCLSAAEHAAMVEVDEQGVTGAAYTLLAVTEGAFLSEETIDFVLDRPFLFIVTGADGSILFAGIVKNIA